MYTLFFDGASRGNPGVAGAGFVIEDEKGETFDEGYAFLGDNVTNNYAEYSALHNGLIRVLRNGIYNILIKGDSLLVIKQMRGEYRCKSANLKELFVKCRKLIKAFKNIEFEHIRRDKNKKADKLANLAIDEADF